MDAPTSSRILYLVWVLLMAFNLLSCVHSQGAGDVWFSFRNTTYQNNSCVALEDLGEGDDALDCRTNQSACCRLSNTRNWSSLGNWFFPNGTRVHSSNQEGDFYRTRGQMSIRLNRRRGGVDGIYHCKIPNSMNVTQTIYIGVYTASTNTGAGDVWFSFRNTTYQNNSCVALEDLGEGDDALDCRTNQSACCRPSDTVNGSSLGNWFFPNATRVHSFNQKSDFYRSRGQMSVRLNRRRGGVDGIYHCKIPDSMNVTQTIYMGVYTTNTSTASIPDEAMQTVGPFTTTETVPVCTAPVTSTTQPTTNPPSDGATPITTTVPVSSSTQTTNNPPTDGATTTSVIIVVAVVIILVVIAVGVVILVLLFRAKERKQLLEINKLQNVTQERETTLKHKGIEEASSNVDQPPYAEIQTKAQPHIPSKSEDRMEYSNKNSTLDGEYSEIELVQDGSKHALPAKPPRQNNFSDPMSEETESSLMYQDVDQLCDPFSSKSVPQETDIYTLPDTVETQSGTSEAVYSEPIQPSLFTDAVSSSSNCEDIHPYAPIYTIPSDLPKSEGVPLKVFGSNIREIQELGIGFFGKVILAETVGRSANDLGRSKSDEDKSKSTLVAVKKLKSDAPNVTKEAFEKEVNFMSRLTGRNVIRILRICYEGTPFIMMEYMEKGDLNQYLRKFKTLGTTDSELQGLITTRTLVHMTTQIASAMKYLASHNFVHRDLATRNCLVGSNYLVKISDFGMSRSLYDSHYYCIHGCFALPVRWMAYECFYGKFSQKSDVWAFGVTMWEIFTLVKEKPYNDMSDMQVVEDALKGKNRKTLARPDMCPLKVYKIMLECWEHNSKQRATFEELFQLLTSIHNV